LLGKVLIDSLLWLPLITLLPLNNLKILKAHSLHCQENCHFLSLSSHNKLKMFLCFIHLQLWTNQNCIKCKKILLLKKFSIVTLPKLWLLELKLKVSRKQLLFYVHIIKEGMVTGITIHLSKVIIKRLLLVDKIWILTCKVEKTNFTIKIIDDWLINF